MEPVTLGIATAVTPHSSHGLLVQAWADAVAEESGGAITIDIYPTGQLLAGLEILPGVADGRVDMGFTYPVYNPQEFPLLNVASIPFMTEDAMALAQTFNELQSQNPELQDEIDGTGTVILAFFTTTASAMGYAEPIDDIGQLDGLRLRAGLVAPAVEAVGASAEFLEFAEVYEAVERGILDGWAGTDFGAAVGQGFHEVTPVFNQLGTGLYTGAMLVIGQETWDSLPLETQEIIAEVSDRFPEAGGDVTVKAEAEACAKLRDSGGTMNILAEDQIEEWRSILGEGPKEEWRNTAVAAGHSPDVVDSFFTEYEKTLREYEAESEWVDGMRACAETE